MVNAAEKLPVLIAGGGLGGLGLALALGRRGVAVQVLEQANEIVPIGYGIQLGPNVFPIFIELGVYDAVLAASHQPPALVMPDSIGGDELLRIPVNTTIFKERFEHPYVVIHRGDLHDILLTACADYSNIELTSSANVIGYREHPNHISVRTEDNRSFDGLALVAADGVKSLLRETFVAEKGPVPIGYVAHRTTVSMSDVPPGFPYRDEVVLWAGPGHHVVNYPLQDGKVLNIVAVFKSDGGSTTGDYQREFDSVYRNVCPDLRGLLQFMDLKRRWDLSDRDPIRSWYAGRVVLLGDAAHPALQSLAQGACMALEDASCLAQQLSTAVDLSLISVERAFAAYQKARFIRTARLQLESRSLWGFYHAGGIEREVRNAALSERSVSDSYQCVSWLWDSRNNAQAVSTQPDEAGSI
ncbi:MAG: FAD-dependent monooxygenase [Burkholderiaceae bacterium]